MNEQTIHLDCLIFGGGVAGLFTLNKCIESGLHTLLLESSSLGTGQTIGSQGIIHGGLKYEITGTGHDSAMAIKEMPLYWRRCLAGETTPDLTGVTVRSDYCHVWKTKSIMSKLGWIGAKLALRVKPQILSEDECPPYFKGMGGKVARLAEQVIEPRSLIEVLHNQHQTHMLKTAQGGVEAIQESGSWKIRLLNPVNGEPLDIITRKIVLTAGRGNAALRELFNLPSGSMQERPLQMVLVRGNLPSINGHCIDGAKTRVTITTTTDYAGRNVWQVGGQIAEDGANMSSDALVCHAARELQEVLPNVNLTQAEFLTYYASRAESAHSGVRPSDMSIIEEGDIYTCWPTKLAFAPRLANALAKKIGPSQLESQSHVTVTANWPKPDIALPPWETDAPWTTTSVTCQ